MYFMCSVSLHERMFHTSMINQQIHVTIRKATGSQMQPQVISSYISYNYFILILFLLYEPLMMIRSVTKTCWWRIIMSLKIFINVYLLICGNKMPSRCNRGFYCRPYCLLNMFRASLCPSSGAQEYYTVVAACGISCCGFSSSWSGVELRVMCPVCRMLQHCIILLSFWWWA